MGNKGLSAGRLPRLGGDPPLWDRAAAVGDAVEAPLAWDAVRAPLAWDAVQAPLVWDAVRAPLVLMLLQVVRVGGAAPQPAVVGVAWVEGTAPQPAAVGAGELAVQ